MSEKASTKKLLTEETNFAQENEQSRAWDGGGPDERDGGHAGARDGAEEPGGAVPCLGACCSGERVKNDLKLAELTVYFLFFQNSGALTLSPVMSAVLGLSHSGGVTR